MHGQCHLVVLLSFMYHQLGNHSLGPPAQSQKSRLANQNTRRKAAVHLAACEMLTCCDSVKYLLNSKTTIHPRPPKQGPGPALGVPIMASSLPHKLLSTQQLDSFRTTAIEHWQPATDTFKYQFQNHAQHFNTSATTCCVRGQVHFCSLYTVESR